MPGKHIICLPNPPCCPYQHHVFEVAIKHSSKKRQFKHKSNIQGKTLINMQYNVLKQPLN
eukprot:5206013-Ditylum_brightwellii.AAC.1